MIYSISFVQCFWTTPPVWGPVLYLEWNFCLALCLRVLLFTLPLWMERACEGLIFISLKYLLGFTKETIKPNVGSKPFYTRSLSACCSSLPFLHSWGFIVFLFVYMHGKDSTVSKALALQANDLALIPSTTYGPWALPSVIPEYRISSKPWALLGISQTHSFFTWVQGDYPKG